jgi:hypothetical protein
MNKKVLSHGQQFHQYQQNEQSPVTVTHGTQRKTTTYTVGNPDPGLGQAQKYGGVKPVNGIPTHPLLIIGCPVAIYIHFHSKRPDTIRKLDGNIKWTIPHDENWFSGPRPVNFSVFI